MCSGSAPAAPESRDLLAIIHPAHSTSRQPQHTTTTNTTLQRPSLAGRLRLSNAGTGFTTTYFQPTPESTSVQAPLPSPVVQVRIHRFGSPLQEPSFTSDTNSGTTSYFPENPVIHAFSISIATAATDDGSTLGLAQSRFDLGVGGEGIVGRTISVADWEGGFLGQGIIGRM